jgi:hypothetical protein
MDGESCRLLLAACQLEHDNLPMHCCSLEDGRHAADERSPTGQRGESKVFRNLHKITFASWIMFMQKLSPRFTPFGCFLSLLFCPLERHNFHDDLKVAANARPRLA